VSKPEAAVTPDDVRAQLARVQYPGFQRDIVSFGMVGDVRVDDDGIFVELTPGTAKADVLSAIRARVAAALAGVAQGRRIEVRVPETTPGRAATRNPFDERAPLPGVRRILAVASGKGGVGKSTVAVNLALAAHARGVRVGLLDADIYGPSIPLMMGVPDARPRMAEQKKIYPVEHRGLALISMGFFLDDRAPVIWRGPMVMSIVRQFLKDVHWGELDLLVVDLPPGTGDAQLTLMQEVPVSGGLIVTTPQDVALQDVKRGIAMFQTVNTPVLGIVENMSHYVCPQCGTEEAMFGSGGGRREAAALGVPLLAEIPLVPEVRACMDRGEPIVVADPEGVVAVSFGRLAAATLDALEATAAVPES
jgi:ATP-binding protein involved in chromosome partitioning